MSSSPIYRRSPGVVFRSIAGETLLVPAAAKTAAVGRLFTLNATGAFVWGKLDGKRNVSAIAREMAKEYRVGEAAARADVADLLSRLEALRAVERSARPQESPA